MYTVINRMRTIACKTTASAVTTTISASTHAGLRPNPCRYAIALAALHPISTANSSHPIAGWSNFGLTAIWKYSA